MKFSVLDFLDWGNFCDVKIYGVRMLCLWGNLEHLVHDYNFELPLLQLCWIRTALVCIPLCTCSGLRLPHRLDPHCGWAGGGGAVIGRALAPKSVWFLVLRVPFGCAFFCAWRGVRIDHWSLFWVFQYFLPHDPLILRKEKWTPFHFQYKDNHKINDYIVWEECVYAGVLGPAKKGEGEFTSKQGSFMN